MFENRYVYSLSELPAVVSDVILLALERQSMGAFVIALQGDLGAGKTTFVQELARQLGVSETVTSPTFMIMKYYDTTHTAFSQLIHIDAYRIEDLNELAPLRFKALVEEPKSLVCIEWPERIQEALPLDCLHIAIEIEDQEHRTAQVSGVEV